MFVSSVQTWPSDSDWLHVLIHLIQSTFGLNISVFMFLFFYKPCSLCALYALSLQCVVLRATLTRGKKEKYFFVT